MCKLRSSGFNGRGGTGDCVEFPSRGTSASPSRRSAMGSCGFRAGVGAKLDSGNRIEGGKCGGRSGGGGGGGD